MPPVDQPSTFSEARRPSINFCQPSVRPVDFRQLPATIRATRRLSFKFLCGREVFHQLPSTFHVAGRPSVNFHQFSVQPGDLPSSCVNLLCGWETFQHLLATIRAATRPSFKFSCSPKILSQLPSTFCAAGRPFVNLRQLFMLPKDFLSTSRAARRLSSNFQHLSVPPEGLPAAFQAAGRYSMNFYQLFRPCVNFRQFSAQTGGLL